MRLFIDECLSPKFALDLAELGHDAIHPLHVGRRGQLDHTVKETCLAEDRVLKEPPNPPFGNPAP